MTIRLKLFAPSIALLLAGAAAAADPSGRTAPVTVNQLASTKLELVLAGEKISSRDALEAYLLLKAAQLAQQRGADWFTLAHGLEDRPGEHPPRAQVSYGAAYRHWQPHWFYQIADQVWQPWYPEWGVRFWADEPDLRGVERFQVHAIIELGQGRPPEADAVFEVKAIMADKQLKLAAGRP